MNSKSIDCIESQYTNMHRYQSIVYYDASQTECAHELPGDLVNADSGSESLRWGLRFCIFNMLSGEAAAAGLWLPLGVKLYVVPLCHHLLKFPHSHSHWFPSRTLQSKMMWGS